MLRLGVTSAAIRIPAGKGTVALKTGPKRTAKTAGTPPASIAIIGGSGLYSIAGLSEAKEVRVKTPFGDPSDAIVTGLLEGKRVAFLARHGRGHRFPPGEINYRANIYALKLLGADRIISPPFLEQGSWLTSPSTSPPAPRCHVYLPMPVTYVA